VLAQVRSGGVKYQASKVDDLKVFVYGDAAVVNGRWKARFVEKGKLVDTAERFTDTYVRLNGQWRCVASQGSTIR
jgi:ketosteroid isomerase-like protein